MLTGLAAQIAYMARLHLVARPLMQYSVHLTICGALVNLAILDCVGGVISKDYIINEDLETFIHIIPRLGLDLDLDAYDLGVRLCLFTTSAAGSSSQSFGPRLTDRHTSRRDCHWQPPGLDLRLCRRGCSRCRADRAKTFILMKAWSHPLADEPREWIFEVTQFKRAMTLVAGQVTPRSFDSTKPITVDTVDALCDELITGE